MVVLVAGEQFEGGGPFVPPPPTGPYVPVEPEKVKEALADAFMDGDVRTQDAVQVLDLATGSVASL